MPLSERLPPLSALRVFEAAARHPNFSVAAGELHVTPGAVSRQISVLEASIGVALFVREPRRTRLTAAGVQLAERLRVVFGLLHDAVRDIGREDARRVVVLAIRYGRGRWPRADACPLLGERLFPVCAPKLARSLRPRSLDDVLAMPLIHDSDFPWSLLLEQQGMSTPRRLPGIRVDDSSIAMQAAERGQGVLLGRSVLVADALAEGRLKRLLRVSVASEFSYHVAWPRQRNLSPAAEAFRSWLCEAAAASA